MITSLYEVPRSSAYLADILRTSSPQSRRSIVLSLQQIDDPPPRKTHRYHVCGTGGYLRNPSVGLLAKVLQAKATVSRALVDRGLSFEF